ncbi:DEAD/DEAH box helicase [Serratia sp. D1N4]
MEELSENEVNDKIIFNCCHEVNKLIIDGDEVEARNTLVKLLDFLDKNNALYNQLINNLIRQLGLYPYLRADSSSWQERFIYDAFKVDVGLELPVTLHREQSLLLKKLINGESLAISAPTSFGKSFIIDAFISIKKPKNVIIIVPTIALTDETRRRLQKKFSDNYKIITTSDVELAENNIFVFPQERAFGYIDKIDSLDILIVDEFYKASDKFDKERAPSLLKAIMKLSKKAEQRYFLSPNISNLKDNPFTKGMEFIRIDFNTVFLEKHELYKDISEDKKKKEIALMNVLSKNKGKTLIYAGTYKDIDIVADIIISEHEKKNSPLLDDFSNWLSVNYDKKWKLTELIKLGTGIHNGRLHRSLSQIQVKLFEEPDGINNIISTSSIIEGVNTSAENIIIWRAKNGRSNLNDFMYKNIIGRGGRMFKHFIGKIFLLSAPPDNKENELVLDMPNSLIGDIDENEYRNELTQEQIALIIAYREDMSNILGHDTFKRLQDEGAFKSNDALLIRDIAIDIARNPTEWSRIIFLNSASPDNWDYYLYKVMKLKPSGWDIEYSKFVGFVKVASRNWELTLPQLLKALSPFGIDIEKYFQLEKNLTFKLSALLNDTNILLKELIKDKNTDISPFIFKITHAFLPPIVYQLEEYGLPRMLSKKLQAAGYLIFDNENINLHQAIDYLKSIDSLIGLDFMINADAFEKYIIKHFIDGVVLEKQPALQ